MNSSNDFSYHHFELSQLEVLPCLDWLNERNRRGHIDHDAAAITATRYPFV